MRHRWGQRASRREEDLYRFLSRVRVKVPRPLQKRLRRKSLLVPQTVARFLSSRWPQVRQPLLRWAAQQATLLSPRRGVASERSRFLGGLQEIFDYASNALTLMPGPDPGLPKVQRLELTRLSGPEALEQAKLYHSTLQRLDQGYLAFSSEENPYQVAALLGISPAQLRSRAGPRNVDLVIDGSALTRRLRVAAAEPLVHRHEVFRLPKKRALIWVHPDDKGRLGAGYGWCVNDHPTWRRTLQFAVVGPDNRPHALLTVPISNLPPNTDLNDFIIRSPGRARIDYAKLREARAAPYYGQIKGRYNERPVRSPYREDMIRWVATQPLGPLRVLKTATAPPDWAALLTIPNDIPQSKRNWKAAGGAPAIFSVADNLDVQAMGEGGPSERTATYFGGRINEWLKTPLAPLVIAALGTAETLVVSPELPPALVAERARVGSRKMPQSQDLAPRSVLALQDTLRTKRSGISLPEDHVRGWRTVLQEMKDRAKTMSSNRAFMKLRKAALLKRQRGFARAADQVGEVDQLAAVWKIFREDPKALLRLGVAADVVRATQPESPFVNTLLCDLFTEGVLLAGDPRGGADLGLGGGVAGSSGRAATKARGILIDQMAQLSTEIAQEPADPELIDEIYAPSDFLDDVGEDVRAQGRPLAWVLSNQSEPGGGGGWHCARCAGFDDHWYDRTTSKWATESRPYDTGFIPDCHALTATFYPKVLEWWLVWGGPVDLGTFLMTSALAPYGDAGSWREEQDVYIFEVLEGTPVITDPTGEFPAGAFMTVEEYVVADAVLALGFLKSINDPEFAELWGDQTEGGGQEWTKARWAGRLDAFSRSLSPQQRSILKKMQATVKRSVASKVTPLEAWSRLVPYQDAWARLRAR